MSEISRLICFPFQGSNFMAGFNPLQGMNLGLQNLGANIRAMTQNIVANSINQAQTSFQSSIANAIQRAEADGTRFDFQTELQQGEFRQFTDQTGITRGFYHRYCIVCVVLYSKRIYSAIERKGGEVGARCRLMPILAFVPGLST